MRNTQNISQKLKRILLIIPKDSRENPSVTRAITAAPVMEATKVSEDGQPGVLSDSGSRSSHCLRDTSSHLQEAQEEDLPENTRGRGEALPRILYRSSFGQTVSQSFRMRLYL